MPRRSSSAAAWLADSSLSSSNTERRRSANALALLVLVWAPRTRVARVAPRILYPWGFPSFLPRALAACRAALESVRRDHAGLHSFLSMSLIEARRRNASALRLKFSQSLARRLHRPNHANVRSTTHRFGRATNPFA